MHLASISLSLIFTINEIQIADVIIDGIKFIEIPSKCDKQRAAKGIYGRESPLISSRFLN